MIMGRSSSRGFGESIAVVALRSGLVAALLLAQTACGKPHPAPASGATSASTTDASATSKQAERSVTPPAAPGRTAPPRVTLRHLGTKTFDKPLHHQHTRISPDGQWVLNTANGRSFIWNLQTRETRRTYDSFGTRSVWTRNDAIVDLTVYGCQDRSGALCLMHWDLSESERKDIVVDGSLIDCMGLGPRNAFDPNTSRVALLCTDRKRWTSRVVLAHLGSTLQVLSSLPLESKSFSPWPTPHNAGQSSSVPGTSVQMAQFSPDGRRLAVLTTLGYHMHSAHSSSPGLLQVDKGVAWYDVTERLQLRQAVAEAGPLQHHPAEIGFATKRDALWLFHHDMLPTDPNARLFGRRVDTIPEGVAQHFRPPENIAVEQMALAPRRGWILLGHGTERVALFDLASGAALAEITLPGAGAEGALSGMAISPDETHAVVTRDKSAYVIQIREEAGAG